MCKVNTGNFNFPGLGEGLHNFYFEMQVIMDDWTFWTVVEEDVLRNVVVFVVSSHSCY